MSKEEIMGIITRLKSLEEEQEKIKAEIKRLITSVNNIDAKKVLEDERKER